MKIILVNEKNIAEVQQMSRDSVMALGFFDGVHKGHQKVIQQAKKAADVRDVSLSVMSFFPHPKTVFSNQEMDYLMPMEQKAKQLQQLGVDIFYIVDFTKQFAALAPEVFITEYVQKLKVQHAVAGFDYTYGAKGAGTIYSIPAHSGGQVTVDIVEEYQLHGSKVSSTCLRSLLQKGDVEAMTQLLGRPYQVAYSIHHGVKAYYTLPAPGSYYATILSPNRAISQTIDVQNDRMLRLPYDVPFDECTIIFHKRVTQTMKLSS